MTPVLCLLSALYSLHISPLGLMCWQLVHNGRLHVHMTVSRRTDRKRVNVTLLRFDWNGIRFWLQFSKEHRALARWSLPADCSGQSRHQLKKKLAVLVVRRPARLLHALHLSPSMAMAFTLHCLSVSLSSPCLPLLLCLLSS